ncbi:hypothetical protein NKR23_g8850 [Pleurostoma richardsiae]|uniref:Uncharacterized protein n=1 Tax=Pleurostoma richardsiae TaxID=41990 RepID=A0AA38RPH6_9PEZI|nr:hypothetical protein NKR23_g8850 [Pleurostoma richardsiae]
MTTTRPKLPQLRTPVSASFPSDAILSASTVRTPLSASIMGTLPSAGLPSAGLPSADFKSFPATATGVTTIKQEEKTPITPPVAYMDFLKSMSMASPSLATPPLTAPLMGKTPMNRMSTASSTTSSKSNSSSVPDEAIDPALEADTDSAPSTATSEATDCSCTSPATGPTSFPSLRIPPSPAVDSPVRSPFSARSVRSPFDWEAALKARRYTDSKTGHGVSHSSRCEKSRTSVKHIREVVTRTVTYTPRMDPAPKGKRRKVD